MQTVFNQSFPTFELRKPVKSLVLPMALSKKTVWTISCISDAVYLSFKQNLQQMHRSFTSSIRKS
jgi:hypothetical protein